jgi:hypothetical protein
VVTIQDEAIVEVVDLSYYNTHEHTKHFTFCEKADMQMGTFGYFKSHQNDVRIIRLDIKPFKSRYSKNKATLNPQNKANENSSKNKLSITNQNFRGNNSDNHLFNPSPSNPHISQKVFHQQAPSGYKYQNTIPQQPHIPTYGRNGLF